MKNTVAELFQRFVAMIPPNPEASLHADLVQAADGAAKVPQHTVLVQGCHAGTQAPLALVLMTVPSRTADESAALEFAARRARAYKAPYFVTWTLRDAVLWKTPKPGTPAARDSMEKLRDYPDLFEIDAAGKDPLSEPQKLLVLGLGKDILHDLERLLKDEALELVQIDATFFVGRLLDAVHHLWPVVSDSLQHRLERDVAFRREISDWAVKQGIAGAAADPEFARSIARQITYRLLGKILFYQSLRRSARQLPKLDLDHVDSAQVLPALRAAFREALKIDYHAVFEEDLPDRIQWPAEASTELAALIHDFNTRDFASLPLDVVGTVFERLIPPEERHSFGQYFTNENLCDLVNAFCIRSVEDVVFDSTCGTGTLLIRGYDRLRWLGRQDHARLLSQLWGVDIAPFPAELATINLFRQRIGEHGNFPRIICQDFLRLSPGDKFGFPPPKMNLEHPETIEEEIPSFDAIVGNFPYVNAAQIEKHEAGYLQFLHQRMVDGWFERYPHLFYYPSKKQQENFEKHIALGTHANCDREAVQHRISTYADLYVYLFFHAARFLKPGGRMGIVTSNAWLDANYGHALQDFFLRRFKIVAILESRCEPWFIEASVNTVVTILERCDSEQECHSHLVKFVKVKRPLADLIPGDPVLEAANRWKRLGRLVEHVEHAGRKFSKTHPLGIVTEEDDDFRIRILRQGEMLQESERTGKTVKWGRYLRAPQVFCDLLEHGKLCPMSQIAEVSRGSLSGLNEFYHLTPERAQELGIEPEFLKPLLKSPGESNQIPVERSQLNLRVFVCRLTKEELAKRGKTGALSYITWGEKQRFAAGAQRGLTWPNGAEVRVRKPGWYAIPKHRARPAQVFIAAAIGDRFRHRFSQVPLIADKRLYFLVPVGKMENELLAALMNCSITALSTELAGRVSMGEGVLDLTVEDVGDYLLLPDLRSATVRQRETILDAFRRLCQRDIGSIYEEVQQEDRQVLDAAVLVAIGLEPKKYLKPLYEGLCMLVRERSALGQMRGTARQTKARGDKAERETVEEVLDETIPGGPRRFPDEFYSVAAAQEGKADVPLPDEMLVFENSPLFRGVHAPGGTFNRDVKTPAEGKFMVYAQRAGQKVAHFPEKTVEVTRTVANYEKYLRELRQQLYEAYYRRTLDTRSAGRLTQAAFDRFRLPSLSQE